MLISTKGRYALRVMTDLAQHNTGEYITLMDIAKRQEISEKYLESIISMLGKGGFVLSLRGKGGGYKLSRQPEDYTVASVLRLTEGTLAPVACLEGQTNDCRRSGTCLTLPVWKKLYSLIDGYLESVTIADLITPEGDYVI